MFDKVEDLERELLEVKARCSFYEKMYYDLLDEQHKKSMQESEEALQRSYECLENMKKWREERDDVDDVKENV